MLIFFSPALIISPLIPPLIIEEELKEKELKQENLSICPYLSLDQKTRGPVREVNSFTTASSSD